MAVLFTVILSIVFNIVSIDDQLFKIHCMLLLLGLLLLLINNDVSDAGLYIYGIMQRMIKSALKYLR